MRAFASHALNCLRMEKGYRGGSELANDGTPLDAGLGRLVKFDKDFVGKEPLQAQQQHGADYQLVLLSIDNKELDPLGGEAVLADGKRVGSVSSAGYGHHVDQSLAFAFLPATLALDTCQLQVLILGEPFNASVLTDPPFDPGNTRLRG